MICLCEHLFQKLALTFTPGNSCQGPEALLEITHSLRKAHIFYIHSKEKLTPEVRSKPQKPDSLRLGYYVCFHEMFLSHFVLLKDDLQARNVM